MGPSPQAFDLNPDYIHPFLWCIYCTSACTAWDPFAVSPREQTVKRWSRRLYVVGALHSFRLLQQSSYCNNKYGKNNRDRSNSVRPLLLNRAEPVTRTERADFRPQGDRQYGSHTDCRGSFWKIVICFSVWSCNIQLIRFSCSAAYWRSKSLFLV